MAYQKLQTGRALEVIYSDTINIPNIADVHATGVVSAAPPGPPPQLVVASGDFLTSVKVGDIVYNTTAKTVATVTGVVDDVTLNLSAATVTAADEFVIYGDTNNGCVLYLGGAGNLRVVTVGGDDVLMTGVLAGTYVPMNVMRVKTTDTTVAASVILAMW
tara:strand:- start:2981 stop:3460 length:480 start_codon:yes stop_codon:yes gene_type:complete